MTSEGEASEAFENLSGTLLVFLGQRGSGGVLCLSKHGTWEFLPVNSLAWDGYHQEIYRNFRGERLDAKALADRGIELPPLDQYRNRPALSWRDNFTSEMALSEVPPDLRRRLPSGAFPVFLVMLEDGYETAFGDGKFLYAERAYWSRVPAEQFLEDRRREAENPAAAKDPAQAQWYRYALKEIRVTVDGDRVRADLALETYEHVSLDKVLRLLADCAGP